MMWLLILIVGTIAGTLGGIVGFGASLLLMPVLVFAFGPKEAVPIMAMSGLIANMTRVAVWWRQVDWRAAIVYSLPAIPSAALGARTMVALNPRLVEGALGAFFLIMVPVRRWLARRGLTISLWHLALVGVFIGYLSGIVASTGPINTPFFLAYGLQKGAFLATEALGSVFVQVTKAITFRTYGALPWEIIARGLLVGGSLMLGSWLAKFFVQRMEPHHFRGIIDALMIGVGLFMLVSAIIWTD